MTDQQAIYDQRYAGDYRSTLAGYEVARVRALDHFRPGVARATTAARVLDYGCGSGLHVPLWQERFPGAELWFADISTKALEKLAAKFPAHAPRCRRIVDDHVDLADASFDAVVSVEVMEHVEHLDRYLGEVYRVLRPGGVFIWTTPCANALSIEHLYNIITRQIDPTPSGSRRWRWEDPTHLRRLTTREASGACRVAGFEHAAYRFRAHFFSFVCTRLLMKRHAKLAERLMLLDYSILRRLPNAASMIGAAWKPAAAPGAAASRPRAAA